MPNYNERHQFSKISFCSLKIFLKVTAVAGVAAFIALAGINAQAEPIIFKVNITDPLDWTQEGVNALKYAANIWGSLISANYTGETITIDADFGALKAGALADGHPIRGISGTLIPNASSFYNSEYYFFPSATANHIAREDLENPKDPTHSPESEIAITFSPDSDHPAATWWYDTNNPPPAPPSMPAHYDFVTIALHEIAHGLGLVSGLTETAPGILEYPFTVPGTFLETGWYYDMYVFNNEPDHFDAQGNPLADGFPISVDKEYRLALVTDPGHLIFGGPYAKEANGGLFPVLYSPPLPSPSDPDAPGFVQGSSVSHLSENPDYGHPGDLMIPHAPLSLSNHSPSALDLAMLEDVGWISVAAPPGIPEPSSLLLLMTGTGMLFFTAYRRKRK